jgi:hypothetical protein
VWLLPRRRLRAGRGRPCCRRLFRVPDHRPVLLPLVALVWLLVSGEINGSILFLGGLSAVIAALAAIAGYLFLRRERSARWLGAKAQRPPLLDHGQGKARSDREPEEKATELRATALALLRTGWATGLMGLGANLAVTY